MPFISNREQIHLSQTNNFCLTHHSKIYYECINATGAKYCRRKFLTVYINRNIFAPLEILELIVVEMFLVDRGEFCTRYKTTLSPLFLESRCFHCDAQFLEYSQKSKQATKIYRCVPRIFDFFSIKILKNAVSPQK